MRGMDSRKQTRPLNVVAGHATPLREAMPHQSDAIVWGRPKQYFPCYMEMRLGKSLVITRWAKAKNPNHVLILAPASTIPDWLDELKREQIEVHHLTGSRQRRADYAGDHSGWFITNYEGVCIPDGKTPKGKRRYRSPLLELLWDVVVLDESTRIKNPQAGITKQLLKYRMNFNHRAILSGYPAPEGPSDYFCQMQFLYGEFAQAKNWWQFRDIHYHNPWGFEWIPKSGTLDYVKRQVRGRAYVLRRKDAGIGSKKFYERRVVPLNAVQKRLIKEIDTDFEYSTVEGITTTKSVLTTCIWMQRIAGGYTPDGLTLINPAKQKAILELLKGDLKTQSILIWFRFNREIWGMRNFLEGEGYHVECITGVVPFAARKLLQRDFNNHKFPILLMQVQCGKMGIDLSGADTAIYYSNSWSGESRAQSEDRIIHPVKRDPLLYVDIVSKGSADEDVLFALREKSFTAKRFMARFIEKRYGKK